MTGSGFQNSAKENVSAITDRIFLVFLLFWIVTTSNSWTSCPTVLFCLETESYCVAHLASTPPSSCFTITSAGITGLYGMPGFLFLTVQSFLTAFHTHKHLLKTLEVLSFFKSVTCIPRQPLFPTKSTSSGLTFTGAWRDTQWGGCIFTGKDTVGCSCERQMFSTEDSMSEQVPSAGSGAQTTWVWIPATPLTLFVPQL